MTHSSTVADTLDAGHTPGPWTVAGKGYGWDHFAAIVTPTGIVANCHIAALSRSYEQTAADARLIAAAPDLLDALDDLVSRLANTGHHNSIEMAAARKALAKARGEVQP